MIGGNPPKVIGAGAGRASDLDVHLEHYTTDRLRGTMYYAKTTNMKSSENELRKILCDDSLFHYSPPNATRGRVYVVIDEGRRGEEGEGEEEREV